MGSCPALSLIYWHFEASYLQGSLVRRQATLLRTGVPCESKVRDLVIERSIASLKVSFHGTLVVFRTLPSMGNIVVVEPSDGTLVSLFRVIVEINFTLTLPWHGATRQ